MLVPGAGAATPTDPAKDLPKPGCVTLSDPKGDSTPLRPSSSVPAGAPNDPDLDITSLTLRSTATEVVAYVGVDKLAAGPSTTDGHRYTLDFTFNKHVFSAAGSSYKNASGQIRDGLAATGQAGHVTQLGVDVPPLVPSDVPPPTDKGFKSSGLKFTWDLTNSRVVIELPIADIVKYGGAPFAGDITAVDAKSATDTYAVSSQADITIKDNGSTSTDKWTIGNNACFAAPPAVLTNTGVTTAQYGDTAAVAATLTSTSGQALASRPVAFTLAGHTVTANTDASGIARATLPVTVAAGATTLHLAFAGDADADTTALDVPFTVAVEKAVLKVVAKAGGAQATLLDDDKHPIAGQVITFTMGSKTVKAKTNASGVANIVKIAKGTAIKVGYAGSKGYYAATPSYTVKAL